MNERLKTHSKTQKKSADLVSNKLRIGVFQRYQMKCKSVSKKSPRYTQVQSDIQNAVDVVDTASDDLNASIASLGETQNTMSMLSDAQTDISTSNDELIGSLQDLDYGPASITFTGLEVAMEATLKTYSKVSELNLFSVL
ncbi:hypothetical protein RG55_04825 [Escherichia coli]|nr:hypothetical protein RG54_19655 [Escherichia coli]APK97847.1 hypothetical protein RG55_04825 [Escherichia coli]